MDEKRNRVVRYIAFGLEILIFFVIQGVPNLIPPILGGKPVLLLGIALTIACFENEVPAMAFGIACGAMLDFGSHTHIGFYTITLAVVCFFLGYFSENYFNTSFLMTLVICVIFIPIILSLDFLISYVMKGYGSVGYYFVNHILTNMGYTFVTIPVFYGINRALSRGFVSGF
ncbi:MAG: rod shape-determining protein MreD [Oscillospiraceae bacterium]|nr:rod shape-determining protein MreD [Oscillospiraceae bacterium]